MFVIRVNFCTIYEVIEENWEAPGQRITCIMVNQALGRRGRGIKGNVNYRHVVLRAVQAYVTLRFKGFFSHRKVTFVK